MRGRGQLAGRLIAVVGVFGHAAGDHLVETHRNGRVDIGGFGRPVVAGDRGPARQALVEHGGQGVDVGAGIGVVGASRCHAEIDHVHECAAHQQVRRLHIAVHQPGHVGGFQSGGGLHDDPRRHRRVHGPVAVQQILHGDAVDDGGHHQIEPPVDVAGVVDRDDVRIVEPGRNGHFPPEPLLVAGLGNQLGQQDLDGHVAAHHRVVGLVHRAGAARPQHLEQPIAPEGLAL